jgi:membrane-bound metal-dependent hydrolase YbcI (DUF457 family)
MENLAHTLTGVALARTGLGRRVPFGAATLAAVANLPDIDVIAGFWGPLYYLDYHRGFTHSLPGIAVQGMVVTWLLWEYARRREPDGYRFLPMLAVILLTLATHPLLDWTNTYGLRPFLPFHDARFHLDIFFIIDPYLWVFLGLAVFLTARRTRASRLVWIVISLTIAGVAVQFALNERSGVALLTILALGWALAAFCKWKRPVWPGRVATASLMGILLYAGGLSLLHARTQQKTLAELSAVYDEESLATFGLLPHPANPLRWYALFYDGPDLRFGQAHALGGRSSLWTRYRSQPDHPLVARAMQSCAGRVLTRFGRYDVYEVAYKDGRPHSVIFRDARFSRSGRTGFGVYEILLDPETAAPIPTDPCPPRRAP